MFDSENTMIFTHEASVPLGANDIHLDEWLFNLSERDYKACARGHRAVGTSGGRYFEGMVNVESMAGALIIQHYKTELLEGNHVRLFSERSRAYLMHLLPFHLQVSWEMQVSAYRLTNRDFVARLMCAIHSGFASSDSLMPPTTGFVSTSSKRHKDLPAT